MSTLFVAQKLSRSQDSDAMLKLSLILFASELLWLSGLYAYLIRRTLWVGERLLRNYQLLLAFITSFLGCVSAFILLFLKPGYRIAWVLVLWVSRSNNIISWYLLIEADTLWYCCPLDCPFYNYWAMQSSTNKEGANVRCYRTRALAALRPGIYAIVKWCIGRCYFCYYL